ncbi:MAG: UDP-glucose 4-epimerase GalE [Chloroflexi bacterium]|nr:UDP-glucose 4-epimerase GalE [Chloroflexota bacterium]
MTIEPRTILITGGAGYIGATSANALIAAGHRVVILDDLSSGHSDTIPNEASSIVGSYADGDRMQSLLRDARIDTILHVGALSIVSESVTQPERYFKTNLVGSIALLDAAIAVGVKRMIFSSSAAVYGASSSNVLHEELPLTPVNPYGATKAAFEHVLRAYADAHGLAAIALRYFNVAGATDQVAERHQPETHLLPRLMSAARTGEPFELYGNDYATPDHTAVRDFVHVADVASAHLAAIEKIAPDSLHGFVAINIGSGTGTSVREAVSAVERATGARIDLREHPRRAGDPPRLVADVNRALVHLRWRPRQSDINRIVKSLLPR